jgi:hypothetical protein
MHDALGDYATLPRLQVDDLIRQLDHEMPIEHEEKLVISAAAALDLPAFSLW